MGEILRNRKREEGKSREEERGEERRGVERKGGLHHRVEVLAARLVVEALFNLRCDFINISRP